MTKNKRYTYLDYSKNKYIGSFFCNGVILKNNGVVYRLNEQDNRIKELEKENEKLKIDIMGQSEEIEILSDENERLKQIREEQIETILKQKRKIRELEEMV